MMMRSHEGGEEALRRRTYFCHAWQWGATAARPTSFRTGRRTHVLELHRTRNVRSTFLRPTFSSPRALSLWSIRKRRRQGLIQPNLPGTTRARGQSLDLMSCDDEAFTGSGSDGDISSTDLSVGELGAKEVGAGDPSSPELGDAPPLLSGYSQTYVVRKQDPQRNQGRNRQVCKTQCLETAVKIRLGRAISLRIRHHQRFCGCCVVAKQWMLEGHKPILAQNICKQV